MDRRKSLQMLMFDSDSDDIRHQLLVMEAVTAHVALLKAYHDANKRKVRKRRRRARRPVAAVGLTGTGYDSCVISDSDTSFKTKNKNMKKKSSLSPQPNNPPATESLDTKQIFILSGQSNMAGRGGVFRDHHQYQHHLRQWDGVVPPECGPHPSIHRLDEQHRWEPAREPLHADIDAKKVCGVGPGMAFANAVKGYVGAVGLVPCAVGGTGMKEWARGEEVYKSMVKRGRESVKGGGEIKGLLWYQGESDTSTQHDADAYHGSMVKLIENVREDLGLPSLPFIQVGIGCGNDEGYMEKVRGVQLGMELPNVVCVDAKGLELPNVVCVDAKGLELEDDHLHLTTKAQVQLGQMLADAYLQHFTSSEANSHPAL